MGLLTFCTDKSLFCFDKIRRYALLNLTRFAMLETVATWLKKQALLISPL